MFTTITYADVSDGKELFHEADCLACHEYKDFKYKKKKVHNFKKLHNSVSQCAYSNDAEWFDDEVMDVVKYLNKDFYKFNEK